MESAREQKLLNNIGKRIALIRKTRKVTQQQLAEMIDISVVMVAYIETGKRRPSIMTISKIARALKVPMSDLFEGVDELGKKRGRNYIIDAEQ